MRVFCITSRLLKIRRNATLTFILGVLGCVLGCPPSEKILPCHCTTFRLSINLVCDGLMNPDELEIPVQATAARGYGVDFLSIENSSLLYIPSSIFKNTKFHTVRFLNSEVMSLSDTDLAFVGLEDTLREIRATGTSFTAQWDWQQLRNLKKLELIDVHLISMDSVSQILPELPNLRFLGITYAEISFIVPFAFYALKNLEIFKMAGNDISDVQRNMLPEPANSLIDIDLSDNSLSTLPEDFFRNMPSLKLVKLDKNKFITFPKEVFSWALHNLRELTITENDFRCDCRMRWMAGAESPYVFSGTCTSPESLSGRALQSLKFEELWC